MQRICLFPGTFDPVTLGHIDIINRSLPLFDKVVVGIGINASKDPMFTADQRKQWFEEIYKDGFLYKKAGVIVMGLTPNNETQLSLFNTSNPKHQPLMSVVDKLNKAYGKNKIKFANQTLGRQWKMKQEKLSQRYTTNIKEVVEIEL